MGNDITVTAGVSPTLGRIIIVGGTAGGRCTFHCAYCTDIVTMPTTRRRRQADAASVASRSDAASLASRVDAAWDAASPVDCVVVAGPGDPLLWTGCGDFLRRLRGRLGASIAVLTPGPLLSRASLRAAMGCASLVAVKLDAGTATVMRRVNHPHRGVREARLISTLAAFSREFPGRLWVQSLLLPGLNDDSDACARLAAAVSQIAPARLILSGVHGAPMGPDYPAWRPLGGMVHRAVVPEGARAGLHGEIVGGPRAAAAPSGATAAPCWVI